MHIPSLLRSVTLSVFSLLVTVAVVEIFLRTTHTFDARVSYSMPDSILGYRYVPYADYYFHKENPKVITGRINNYGWRDVDWTKEKTKGTTRIAVLGDSFVEAFQVELESTFIKILERNLTSRFPGHRFEVMNFGRSGFAQADELLVLRNEVLQFSPDIVAVCFLPANDVEDARRQTAPDQLRPFFTHSNHTSELILDLSFRETGEYRTKVLVDGLKRSSALLSLVAERYTSFKIAQGIREKSPQHTQGRIGGVMSLCTVHPDPEMAASYALAKVLIEKIVETTRRAGIETLLLTFPTDAYVPARDSMYRATDSTFNANFFDDDLRSLSSSLRIHYLGLQRIFRQEFATTKRALHWAHLNYEGHRLTARALSEALLPVFHHFTPQ